MLLASLQGVTYLSLKAVAKVRSRLPSQLLADVGSVCMREPNVTRLLWEVLDLDLAT